MAYFSKNESMDEKVIIHQYLNVVPENLGTIVHEALKKEGYKLISGMPGNGTYEKGDRTMRLLFGAFVKYSKLDSKTYQGDDGISRLRIGRATSGMSGGLIGMGQVKKEIQRVADLLTHI